MARSAVSGRVRTDAGGLATAAIAAWVFTFEVLGATARADASQPDWFVLKTWSQMDGLPQNTITSIVQGRDGYLWLGTSGGLARFDGMRFTVYDDRDPRQLLENEVKATLATSDGSIWAGVFGGGVSRYHQGRFTVHTKDNGLIDNFVGALAEDRQGNVWIGSDRGLTRFQGGRFQHFTTQQGLPGETIISITADPDEGIWFSIRNGVLADFRGGRFNSRTIPGMRPNVNMRSLCFDRQRALWFATFEGLFRYKDGAFTRFGTAEGLVTDRVLSVHEDAEGNLWAGTVNGLHRYRDGRFHLAADPALQVGISHIASDRERGLWLSMGKLAYLRQGQFQAYTPKEGLSYHWIANVFEDREGSIWITTGKGLNRLRGGQFAVFSVQAGLPESLQGGIAQDLQGHLIVGTDRGLYRSRAPLSVAPDPQFALVDNQPPLTQARAIHVDRQGAVWIASIEEGLMRLQGGAFTVFTTKDGLLHNAVRGIVEDARGDLWVGTRAGLNRLSNGKFFGYTTKDGLVHDSVESVDQDRDGTLWIGTRRGVSRLKDGRFTTFTANQGLLSSFVHGVAEDDLGNLWMASSRGAFRVSKQDLDGVARGQLAAAPVAAFGKEHGMSDSRITAVFDRSVERSRDGRIWYATPNGVSVVDPRRIQKNSRPPVVHVEEVRVDQKLLPTAARVSAPPGRGDITIRYTALSFPAPEKVRFRHRLLGYQRDWVDDQDQRAASYSNLPPGAYTFQVSAANNDGVWNTQGVSLALYLAPHWYQTWLFRVSVGLMLVLGAAGGYLARVRRLKTRQRELERRVAERTAELATANEDLQAFSYSVSHDLRAPLRHIEGFSGAVLDQHAAGLDPEGRGLLIRVRDVSQRTQGLIDDMLVLSQVARGEMHLEPTDLAVLAREIVAELQKAHPRRQVTFVAPPALPVTADASLIRIALENLLNNAWKFTSKRAAARIELGAQPHHGGTAYFVRDDGAGFDPRFSRKLFIAFQRLHAPSDFEGTGVGLTIVRRVIQRHGGQVWAEGQPDAGATFYFTLGPAPGERKHGL